MRAPGVTDDPPLVHSGGHHHHLHVTKPCHRAGVTDLVEAFRRFDGRESQSPVTEQV